MLAVRRAAAASIASLAMVLIATDVAFADDPPAKCYFASCVLQVQIPGTPAQQTGPAQPQKPGNRPAGAASKTANQHATANQAATPTTPVSPVVSGLLAGVAVGQPPAPPQAAAQPAVGVPPLPVVPPAVIAQRAISNLTLTAPPIRMSPPPGSQGATIGFPVWMWLQPGAASTGPITARATAGGVTVTATARLQRVVWTMGDGSTVTCIGPGTPFTIDQAGKPSPDCGHTYSSKSAAVTVKATSIWLVAWQGGGAVGQAILQPNSQVQVPVREVRTLNTTGGT